MLSILLSVCHAPVKMDLSKNLKLNRQPVNPENLSPLTFGLTGYRCMVMLISLRDSNQRPPYSGTNFFFSHSEQYPNLISVYILLDTIIYPIDIVVYTNTVNSLWLGHSSLSVYICHSSEPVVTVLIVD